jgi:hypothetical protein
MACLHQQCKLHVAERVRVHNSSSADHRPHDSTCNSSCKPSCTSLDVSASPVDSCASRELPRPVSVVEAPKDSEGGNILKRFKHDGTQSLGTTNGMPVSQAGQAQFNQVPPTVACLSIAQPAVSIVSESRK